MSGLDKITSLNDIENIVKLDPVEVSPHTPTKTRKSEHNENISASCKKFYGTDKGKKVAKKRGETLRRFYETPHGESIRKKLSTKNSKPKKKAIDRALRKHIVWEYQNGKKISALAEHYNVSRASIYRYIKEFS